MPAGKRENDSAAHLTSIFERAVRVLERSRKIPLCLGLASFALIAILDLVTTEALSFAFFYLIPIALLLWLPNRWLAWVVAAASALLWGINHLLTGDFGYFRFVFSYWDAAVRFGFYAVFILSLAMIRQYIGRLRTGNSELKAAFAALHETERTYRDVFENISGGIVILDVTSDQTFRIITANPAVERMVGVTTAFAAGKLVEEVVPGATADLLNDNYRRCVHTGVPLSFDERIDLPIGRRDIHTALIPLHDEAGRVYRIIALPHDITEIKAAEDALRKSEQRYQEVFKYASDGIFLLDVGLSGHFRVLDINPVEEKRLGMTSGEASGKRNEELMPRETAFHLDQNNRRCVAAGEPITFDDVVELPTGRYEYTTTLSPVRDETGRIYRIIGVSRDVTESRRIERALKQSEEKFSKAFHAIPDAVAISRLSDGTFADVNRGFTVVNGYTREEVIGRASMPGDLQIWVNAEERAAWARMLKEKGEATDFEASSRRKDGSIGRVLLSARIVEIEGETCVLTIARDVTERRRMEEALRESEARYREIFENTSDGVFVVEVTAERRFRLSSFNPAQEKMLGISAAEAVGKYNDEYMSAETAEQVNEDNRRCIAAGRPMTFERSLDLPIGRKHYSTTLVPVRDHAGRIARLIGVTRDVTEQKLAEQRERDQEKQLFQAAKLASLGTLVSGIAHEINNPNNFIRLNTQNLRDIWPDIRAALGNPEAGGGAPSIRGISVEKAKGMVEDLLSGIEEGSKRIEKLLVNLRDFTRGDAGELTQEIDVNAVINSAVLMTRSVIQKSTQAFSIRQTAGLPLVRGNYHQVEQVVINLVTNACQALSSQEGKIAISTMLADDGWVVVEVFDDGVGIPPQNIPRVTDPFFTTKRAQGGSGLGLAVSSRIVANHGGTLSFSSQPGAGTTVTLRLPVPGGVK